MFWFAGLASNWKGGESPRSTYCILTGPSEGTPVASIHDRCPIVLKSEHVKDWLQGRRDHSTASTVDAAARPFRVSTRVNQVKNDSPENIIAVGESIRSREE